MGENKREADLGGLRDSRGGFLGRIKIKGGLKVRKADFQKMMKIGGD